MRERVVDANGLEVLGPEECRFLLSSSHLGRVALASSGRPVVFPVNFVVEGERVYIRTGDGTLLREARDGRTVAFEVDAADPTYQTGWSVLVSGVARHVEAPEEIEQVNRLPLRPWSPGPKNDFVAIELETVSGRRIRGVPGFGEEVGA